jgi:hypothetical protein
MGNMWLCHNILSISFSSQSHIQSSIFGCLTLTLSDSHSGKLFMSNPNFYSNVGTGLALLVPAPEAASSEVTQRAEVGL